MLSASLHQQAEAIAAQYEPPERGRPSHISDAALLQDFLSAIEDGNYIETACELAGLSVVSVFNWRKRGEAGEEPYAAFLKALKRASARAEAKAVANVRQAGKLPQFWAAEMTYLERRHPERWGKRSEDSSQPRVVVQIGVQNSDVQVTLSTSSDQPAHLSPPLSEPLHSLSPTATALSCPIIGDYVNQPEPHPPSNPGARSPEAPTPVAWSGSRQTKRGRQRARGGAGKKKGARA